MPRSRSRKTSIRRSRKAGFGMGPAFGKYEEFKERSPQHREFRTALENTLDPDVASIISGYAVKSTEQKFKYTKFPLELLYDKLELQGAIETGDSFGKGRQGLWTVTNGYGKIIVEMWYVDNKLQSREGNPAIKAYLKNGSIYGAWYHKGILSREGDLPVEEVHTPDGHIGYKAWWSAGSRHRDNGPAIVDKMKLLYGIWDSAATNDKNAKTAELWFTYGKLKKVVATF